MHLARVTALALPLLALLACGGSVSRLGSGGGDGGGDDGPNPNCPAPANVNNGVSCTDPGLSCPSSYTQPSCNGPGAPVDCTCTSGSWQCPVFSGGISCPPPPTSCPPPSLVNPGTSCTTDSSLSCQSSTPITGCNGTIDGYLSCNCFGGQWSCPEPGAPLCPADASTTCPPADTTYAGQSCNTYSGIPCSGDPQTCGGQLVYDTLECQAGQWQVIAVTSCSADAGPGDSSFPDSPWVDAGLPD